MALAYIERRAERIRRRREQLELTQEGLADRMQEIHASRNPGGKPDKTRGQMVSDWERAINEPSGPKIELLAAALDWSVEELNSDPPAEKQRGPAPDMLGAMRGEGDQLDRIERKLDQLIAALETPAPATAPPEPPLPPVDDESLPGASPRPEHETRPSKPAPNETGEEVA